jgi:uncharacterized protein
MLSTPSEREESYFALKEIKRKKKQEEERRKKIKEQKNKYEAQKKRRLKELHYMCCPKCGQKLMEIGYKKLRIDKCSGCRGTWLDEGELEAIAKLDENVLDKFVDFFTSVETTAKKAGGKL